MRLHHIAFRTNDVDVLAAFYRDVLGLAVLRRDEALPPRNIWLDAGGTILMIERRGDQEVDIDSASCELTCFAIAPDEFATMIARLAQVQTPIEGQTAYTIYFRDPDGRRIGLSSYPDAARDLRS